MEIITNLRNKLNNSTLFSRTAKALFYGVGGAAGSRALMLISGVLVSRILGQEYYGKFSMINSTVTLFVTLSGLGIGSTLTRYVALKKENKKELGNIIGTFSFIVAIFSFILSIILLIFSKQMSILTSGSDELDLYYKLASITILFSALGSIQQSILLGYEKYKVSATIELFRCGLYLVISIILSILFSIHGAILALLITFFIKYILMLFVNRKHYKENGIVITFNFSSYIRKILLSFTLPSFFASLFVLPVNWINNSILTRTMGFGELAIFTVALQWKTLIIYIPSQFGQFKPIYTDLMANKKYNELRKLFTKITISSILFVLPIILLGVVFGRFILTLYGKGYEMGYIPFIIMLFSALLITIQSQIGSLFQAIGKMWIGFMLNLIWSIIVVGLFYYIRHLGSLGYAISYFLAYFVHLINSYGVIFILWKRREILK